MKFNAPPEWPQPPADWTPPPGWSPDPSWPPAPEGWQFWVEDTTTGQEPARPGASTRVRTARLTSSLTRQSRRAATASAGLWSRATASSRRHWIFGGTGLGIGLLAGVLLSAVVPGPQLAEASGSGSSWFGSGPTAIEAAVENCGLTDSAGISVGDGGRSISIQTTGAENYYGAEVSDLACVLDGLDASDSVIARMDSTRALDGRQTGSWDGFEASWGYHPDDGINLVIEEME